MRVTASLRDVLLGKISNYGNEAISKLEANLRQDKENYSYLHSRVSDIVNEQMNAFLSSRAFKKKIKDAIKKARKEVKQTLSKKSVCSIRYEYKFVRQRNHSWGMKFRSRKNLEAKIQEIRELVKQEQDALQMKLPFIKKEQELNDYLESVKKKFQ